MIKQFSMYRNLTDIFTLVAVLFAIGFIAFPAMAQDTDDTGGEEDVCWE